MELLQLEYFKMVAKTENITRAAAELHIAQPSLSKIIARLEADLGVALFDRVGRQIRLNQFGKAFLSHVERVLLELEGGKRELSDMIGNYDSQVSIASNNISLFPKLLEGYLKLHPHTCFRQTIGTTEKIQRQLENGTADFGISSPPVEGPCIEYVPLFTEEVFLIVPQGHRFANLKSIHLSEAAGEPFISLRKGFGIRDLTEKFCRQAGFSPNVVFESNTSSKLIDLVNIGLGIGLHPVPPWVELPATKPVFLQIENPVCTRTIGLAFVKRRYLSPAAKYFRDFTIDYFNRLNSKRGGNSALAK